jgi:CheY-like chemotaxis protein
MIVMVGSKGSRGDAAPWLKLGVSSFLTKPVKLSELADAINTIMGTPKKTGVQQEAQSEAQSGVQADATKHQDAEISNERYRILIVEDNMVNRKVAYFMLEKKGHDVTAVENGQEALTALESNIFDLILMDIQMPVLDGFKDRERCLDAGMDDYTTKQQNPAEVFQKINAAMKNEEKQ